MNGEKRTETRMRCYNTLCIPYISFHPSLHVYDCREGRGVIYREYTECYSISFLFLFFFHHSSLYPIKIFAKCFYLLVYIRTEITDGTQQCILYYALTWPFTCSSTTHPEMQMFYCC